jgi:hypothetical protein
MHSPDRGSVESLLHFAWDFWCLVFPFGGVIGCAWKAVSAANERCAERRLEAIPDQAADGGRVSDAASRGREADASSALQAKPANHSDPPKSIGVSCKSSLLSRQRWCSVVMRTCAQAPVNFEIIVGQSFRNQQVSQIETRADLGHVTKARPSRPQRQGG